MKNLKLGISALALTVASTVFAQTTSNPWLIGVGAHGVNHKAAAGGINNFFDNLTGKPLWHMNNYTITPPLSKLTVARNLIDLPKHKLNVGANLRLLFPGAYANFSADNLNGTIVNNFGDISLVDASANINIAYAGVLADDYNDQGNYNEFFSQGINGFATDIAVNYRWKDENDANSYRLNTGLSIKNIGSMTFKSDNNLSKNYILNVDNFENLDLNQFENAESLSEIEAILNDPANAAYFQSTSSTADYTVKLPTVINAYADVRLTKKWFVTGSINQKVSDDSESDVITAQNSYTLIPRFTTKWFEAYAPLAANEISGFTSGIGFRLSGFFIGSNSVFTALADSGKQADLYLGVRFGF